MYSFCNDCGDDNGNDGPLCDSCAARFNYKYHGPHAITPDRMAEYLPSPERSTIIERARVLLAVERDLAAWRRLEYEVADYDRGVVSIQHTLANGHKPTTSDIDWVKCAPAKMKRDVETVEAWLEDQLDRALINQDTAYLDTERMPESVEAELLAHAGGVLAIRTEAR